MGRNIGVYLNWSEAEKQVKGFKGAEYKSFTNEQEAKKYTSVGREGEAMGGMTRSGGLIGLTNIWVVI